MMTETIYNSSDLHHGICEWRGEESDEIVTTEDGEKCIECIEEEMFYQETMKEQRPRLMGQQTADIW